MARLNADLRAAQARVDGARQEATAAKRRTKATTDKLVEIQEQVALPRLRCVTEQSMGCGRNALHFPRGCVVLRSLMAWQMTTSPVMKSGGETKATHHTRTRTRTHTRARTHAHTHSRRTNPLELDVHTPCWPPPPRPPAFAPHLPHASDRMAWRPDVAA